MFGSLGILEWKLSDDAARSAINKVGRVMLEDHPVGSARDGQAMCHRNRDLPPSVISQDGRHHIKIHIGHGCFASDAADHLPETVTRFGYSTTQ